MKTITEMTRELGGFAPTTKFLEQFTELVRADEREACACLVENAPPVTVHQQLERATFKDAAAAIRARGQA
jgi:hypothetical protein